MLQEAARKFEFTGETKAVGDRIVSRIRAIRPIRRYSIEPGDLGGWLQHDEGLDHSGDSWVDGEAMILDRAHVTLGGLVTGSALMMDQARNIGGTISGRALVKDDAMICAGAHVGGGVTVAGTVSVHGPILVSGCFSLILEGQIRPLDEKTDQTIKEIEQLRRENATLRARLKGYDDLQIVKDFTARRVGIWGSVESETVLVPALKPATLASILDELHDLRARTLPVRVVDRGQWIEEKGD